MRPVNLKLSYDSQLGSGMAITDMHWGHVSSMHVNAPIRPLEHSKIDPEQLIRDSCLTYQYILAK